MLDPQTIADLKTSLTQWGNNLGFQAVGIAHLDLSEDAAHLRRWLDQGYHGDMGYMAKHGRKRYTPNELVPNTLSIISARMDYYPRSGSPAEDVLNNPELGYISRYALGRDYHKLFRKKLKSFAEQLATRIGEYGYRVFVDSAPVLERAIARNAGLGWIGKNTNLINKDAGSWFFLGEIYTDLPLQTDRPTENHCGSCRACLDVCPTQAFIGPYELDARKCISYLTIEHRGSIPEELRPLMGNRIYGCDDCQLVCPWNKFAKTTPITDFEPRSGLDDSELVELFQWTKQDFEEKTQGSAIRRIGHDNWLRNIAVALGNGSTNPQVLKALAQKCNHESALVAEHARWALEQHENRSTHVQGT